MIWVPGNVPSLKNSKVKAEKGIFSSPSVNKYIRGLGIQSFSSSKKIVKGYVDPRRPNIFESLRGEFDLMMRDKDYPVFIGYHFVRDSKRKFDFSNAIEIIQDLLTAHDFIPDDNVAYVMPIVMDSQGDLPNVMNIRTTNWYSVDKDNPGVFIKIF